MGFMAYPQPSGVGEAVWREHIMLLDQILYGLWNLGDNLIYAWMPIARGLRVLVAPHPLLTEFAQGDGIQPPGEVIRRTRLLDKLLSTNDPLDEAQFTAVAEAPRVTPRTVELPFRPSMGSDCS